MRRDSRKALLAALLWDRPTLAMLGSESARAFTFAVSRELAIEIDGERLGEEDSLLVAAAGVLRTRAGDEEGAGEAFGVLTRRGGLPRILGLSLQAWLGRQEPLVALDLAARQVKRQRDALLKARLFCKLAAIALELEDRQRARTLLNSASELAPSRSYLGMQVRLFIMNEFAEFALAGEIGPVPEGDDLVDQPWIVRSAAKAGREALVELVESTARGASGFVFRFGEPVSMRVASALDQAIWAGALWLRNQLRLQLGATLLSGGAVTPVDWVHGCGMWILGHGKQRSAVIEMAERYFDEQSGDLLRQYLDALGSGPWDPRVRWETVLGIWDLLSEEAASDESRRLLLPSINDPLGEPAYRLFAALSLRAPTAWLQRFESLSDEEVRGVADGLGPDIAERLPLPAARRLLAVLGQAINLTEDQYILLAALLHNESGDGMESERLRDAPPGAIAEIASRFPGLVRSADTDRAARLLQQRARGELKSAEGGEWSVGAGRDPRRTLGVLLPHVSDERRRESGIATLVATAVSQRAPTDVRVQAALGLWRLADEDKLAERHLKRIRSAQPKSRFWTMTGGTPDSVLEAALLGCLARKGLSPRQQERLLALSRDRDPGTRRVAVAAAGASVTKRPLEGRFLLAGLFDPVEDVVVSALSAIGVPRSRPAPLPRGLVERLEALYLTSGREVRAAVVAACRRLQKSGSRNVTLRRVRDRGRKDRSWVVRDTADRAI